MCDYWWVILLFVFAYVQHLKQCHGMMISSDLNSSGLECLDPESFARRESVCPIHVAAMQGDYDVPVMLLEEGVDLQKETSRGRTALDCALAGDVCGSNQKTVKLLQRALRK